VSNASILTVVLVSVSYGVFFSDESVNEPSDAETIDSESSEDENEDIGDAGSETEQTTEPEEQVVPKSTKGSVSSDNGSTSEVTASDTSTTNHAINARSSAPDHKQKIDLFRYDRLRNQQAAKSTRPNVFAAKCRRPIVVGVLQSGRVLAKLDQVKKNNCMAVQSVESKTQTVTSTTDGICTTTASVGARNRLLHHEKPVSQVQSLPRLVDYGCSSAGRPETHSSTQSFVAPTNEVSLTASTASSVKCRRIVPTFCGNGGTPSSADEDPTVMAVVEIEPATVEQILNMTYSVVDVDKMSQISSNNIECDSSGPSPSTRPTESVVVNDVKTPRRSIDVEPSLGSSVVVADLVEPIGHKKPSFGAVAPASQRDIVKAFHRLRRMCNEDIPLSLMKPQTQSTVPKQQQGVYTRPVSFVLDRPVISSESSVTFDDSSQTGVEKCSDVVDCLTATENATCKPLTSKVSFVNRTTDLPEPNDSAAVDVEPASAKVSDLTVVVRTDEMTLATTSTATEASHCKSLRSPVAFDPAESGHRSGTWLVAGTESLGSQVDRTSLRRKCHGFAASSPLRDGSPLRSMSCSLSSISLASDWEDFETTVDYCNVKSDDEGDDVILLDVAFLSEDEPALLAESFPDLRAAVQCLSCCTTEINACQKSSQKSSAESSKFGPVRAGNRRTSRLHRMLNSRDHVRTRRSGLSDKVVPVVDDVCHNKRTREILSSSDSEDEDGTSTNQNSRALRRRTCLRLS